MLNNRKFSERVFPSKNDTKSERIRKITLIIAFTVFLVSIIVLAVSIIGTAKVKEEQRRRQEEFYAAPPVTTIITTTAPPEEDEEPIETAPPPPLVTMDRFESLLTSNPDTAGWIRVPGTSINDVIVHTDNNDFYVDHGFNGSYLKAGTVFADFRNVVNDYSFNQSDNIILYGHNQKDGTMFGTLSRYKIKHGSTGNFQFYLNNPTFTFSNLYEEYTYKIIACFVIEVEPYQTRDGIIFDYHNYINLNNVEPPRNFESWEENVLKRTAINTGVDFNEEDKFMTLSTCSNEFEPSRFVVIGRRVREGEDPYVDTSLASINESALEPDYNFIWSR